MGVIPTLDQEVLKFSVRAFSRDRIKFWQDREFKNDVFVITTYPT